MPSSLSERAPARDPRRAVTDALVALRSGAPDAMDRLMPLVYGELRRVAHRQLRAERPGHTLSTTALVHESWLKLVDQSRADWRDRAQFFAIAARAMRRVLVDYARRYRAQRRGGGRQQVSLSALDATHPPAASDLATDRANELLALDDALERLTLLEPRLTAVVEYRYFVGLTAMEAADALGVTTRTIERDWAKAKAWLRIALASPDV